MDITDAIKQLEINKKYQDTVLSGYNTLDEFTGGFQKGNLYIIAGKSSMCKSALVLNITRNVAVEQNKGVVFFTLEQSSEKLCNRLLAITCEIELDRISSDKQLEAYEWAKIELEINRIGEKPIYLHDERLTINSLTKYARKMVEEHGVKLIIVDDIHRLAIAEELKKGVATREQEVSHNVRELKALAKELDLPIIAISQLNKGSDNKNPYFGYKKPMLADLRDSGSIEDEADMVMLLNRPEKYGIIEDEWGMRTTGIVQIEIAKNRNGNTTALDKGLRLKFIDKYTKFAEVEDEFTSFGFNALPNSVFDNDTPGSIRLGSRIIDGSGGGFPASNFDEEPPF